MRLSYSKLADYDTCQRKFYHTYIEGRYAPPNKWMEAGRKIHEILYKSKQTKEWKKYLLEHPEYDQFGKMINNYIEYQEGVVIAKGGNPFPIHAEVKMYDKDYNFSLVIDRVDEFNGNIMVTDYKSDAKPVDGKHDNQLLLYAYFFEKLTNKKVTHAAPFYIKARKKADPFMITQEKMDAALTWMNGIRKEILTKEKKPENFPTTTSPLCEYCSHYMTGICEDGKKWVADKYKTKEMEGNGQIVEKLHDIQR